jgi:TetR/AcrR family fatty acid metabolism transcriptional regulator
MNSKKEILLDCARTLFANEGFHKAQISKLANMAGVGAGSVYLYFKNKEHILEEIFLDSWSRIEKRLTEVDADPALNSSQKIANMVRTIIDMIIEREDTARIILHEYRFWAVDRNRRLARAVSHSRDIVTGIISSEKGKMFRDNIEPHAATEYIFGGIWHFLALKSAEISEETADKLAQQISDMILLGLVKK